jgi:catechol 2,3-dioxygenase-like lactoylglutathione lyase family enzyme
MIRRDDIFSGFSVDDVDKARAFYRDVLGVEVTDAMGGALELAIGGGKHVYVYSKPNHEPASYTCLNFPTDDIDAAVMDLKARGVTFEQYPDITDEQGIARPPSPEFGPEIAWFKDPAGNILSVIKA